MVARRLFRYVFPYTRLIVISVVFGIGVSLADAGTAYLVKPVLDDIFIAKRADLLIYLPIGLILLFFFKGFCTFWQQYTIKVVGQRIVQDLRNELYQHMLSLSMRFYQQRSTGSLMSRSLNDIDIMRNAIAQAAIIIVKDSLTVIFLLALIFYQSWQLAVLAFVVMPLTYFPVRAISRRIRKYTRFAQAKIADLSQILQETFSGIKVIKAFGLERKMGQYFTESNSRYFSFTRKAIKGDAMATPVIELFTGFGIALTIWFGGKLVVEGSMTTGELFSFMAALTMLYKPIKQLLKLHATLQASFGAAERVFEVIDTEADIKDPQQPQRVELPVRQVSFEQVGFAYDGQEYVLRDINIEARDNQVVALVGMSGGGKTTIVSLLARFYDVTEGAIRINGVDIRDIRREDLTSLISFVDQETILFNDTIRQNILYGRPDASEEQLDNALRAANALEFVSRLPDGLDTYIGDRGLRLSGGQRQRICLARAIVREAPILILDEATSALDNESEALIQEALTNLMRERMTFVIAHRLSTIIHADQILVLENGSVVEAGTHEELLRHQGTYQRYYSMQFG
ncbi:ABC transporter related protein [Desulfurispirillum indicum S5]|uniref:ABC transporter related protein n=1 Tax=Desulfurispirillum indicum (strain ATCC BAA-1389 / DSM 22839 / S5) TaxID=653733 RepID=E6W2C2_DESIS|nr:ABC transporter ATP-binding protein [Desulfurispirillum indicum]ADU65580.1 ABC transporter related protein [Desulfurispirillum indicum S5]